MFKGLSRGIHKYLDGAEGETSQSQFGCELGFIFIALQVRRLSMERS